MKMKLFLASFSLLSIVVIVYSNNKPQKPKKTCPSNEHYSICDNDCGKSCENVGAKEVKCERTCVSGCFCKDGYFRDWRRYGKCVQPHKCRTNSKLISTNNELKEKVKAVRLICPTNEEYMVCGKHCGKMCDDLGKSVDCSKQICKSGCFCKNDYYRNMNIGGHCVPKKSCERRPGKLTKLKNKWRQFWRKLG